MLYIYFIYPYPYDDGGEREPISLYSPVITAHTLEFWAKTPVPAVCYF